MHILIINKILQSITIIDICPMFMYDELVYDYFTITIIK